MTREAVRGQPTRSSGVPGQSLWEHAPVPKASDDSQIGIATQALERARTDLLGVIQALEDVTDTPVAEM